MNFEFDMFFVFFGVVFFLVGGRWFSLEMIQEISLITIFFLPPTLGSENFGQLLASWPRLPPFFWYICNPEICFVNVFFFFFSVFGVGMSGSLTKKQYIN